MFVIGKLALNFLESVFSGIVNNFNTLTGIFRMDVTGSMSANTNNQYIDNLGGEPFVNQNKRFNSRQLMPDVSIQGKYMITDEWGVRANVGLMFRSIYDNRYATDDKAAALNPLSNDKVVE